MQFTEVSISITASPYFPGLKNAIIKMNGREISHTRGDRMKQIMLIMRFSITNPKMPSMTVRIIYY